MTDIDQAIQSATADETRAVLACVAAFLRGDKAAEKRARAADHRARAGRVVEMMGEPFAENGAR